MSGGPKQVMAGGLLLLIGTRNKTQWTPGMMVTPCNTKGNKQEQIKIKFYEKLVRGKRSAPFNLVNEGKGECDRLHWMGVKCSLACLVSVQHDTWMHVIRGKVFRGHAVSVPITVLKFGVRLRIGLAWEPASTTGVLNNKIVEVTKYGGVGEKILQLIHK